MEEKRERRSPGERWLDIATAGIRFGPDRKAVRAELAEHLEDKTLDFLRIFPDLTEEAARERAAAEMGDPEEIGKELAKVHKPWLGYAWLASKALAVFIIAMAALLFINRTYQNGLANLTAGPSSWYGDYEPPIAAIYAGVELECLGALGDSGPIQMGEYTFTTDQGELWNVIWEDGVTRVLYVQLEVHHSRPLEALNYLVEDNMWAQDDRGGVILSSQEYYGRDVSQRRLYQNVHISSLDGGIFTDRYEVSLEIADPEAERVDLRYTTMGTDLTIPISLEVTQP